MNCLALILITDIVWSTLTSPFWSEMRALLKAQDNERTVNRIAGGRDAVSGEAPWMVSFAKKGSGGLGHFCGGAMIGERTVLTATHCLEK